ncbi:keratin-associated protein 13-2 [Hyaena hyaena]|uniref:keratin-associated protein 13-2 n=1 Tax=Hyaena hyaena TaxID=95912 RepID=UPI0019246AD0|nr:keratin-associated protein 13-2 [Hyaena hyaena]
MELKLRAPSDAHSAELTSPVNMSYSCCSGNFSSRSLGGYLRCPSSSYPSNLVYCTDLCSPSACQLGAPIYGSCQDTCCEPTSCQTSCVVSSPCHGSCSRPRTSTLCSPCQTTYSGSLGFGSRSCWSLGCGSSGFRPLGYGVWGFPSLGYGSSFCRPTYWASRSCQSACYRPTYKSAFCRSTC